MSLLEKVRRQDSEGWRHFCQIYGPLIYAWARRAGLQDSDAADVGQDVLRTVFHKIDCYDARQSGATLRGWLRIITRNKVRDLQRQKAAHHQAVGGTTAWQLREQLPDVDPSTIDVPLPDEERQILLRMLEALRGDFEVRTWQAFWWATVDELPAAEIGERLGMSPTAVRQAKFRVLRRLREMLGSDDGQVSET